MGVEQWSPPKPPAPLPRLGVGHEPAGRFDCFSDGTPPLGSALADDAVGAPQARRARRQRQVVDPDVIKVLHRKMQAAAQQSCGQNWKTLFSDADRDASETLQPDELRAFVRGKLRAGPAVLSNDSIELVFKFLDHDSSGAIETNEFEHFLRTGAPGGAPNDAAKPAARGPKADRQVEANPDAGAVRRRESDRPFLAGHMRAIRTENKRSAASAREKLVFELAKQTHAGLVSALGVHYEMTSIANVIRLAFQTETLGAADVDALPNAADVRKARDVLKSVRAYHLKEVAALLEVDVPLASTWGAVRRDAL